MKSPRDCRMRSPDPFVRGRIPVTGESRGHSLLLAGLHRGGQYALGGTDAGLTVPSPPVSLSAWYDASNDTILTKWENGERNYDRVTRVIGTYGWGGPYLGTTCELRCRDVTKGEHAFFADGQEDFFVIGYVNDCPSAAGSVVLSGDRLEELSDMPFWSGVAPNWVVWGAADAGI